VKRQRDKLKRKVISLEEEAKEKDEEIKAQQLRIIALIAENEELQNLAPTDTEREALECLYAGNLEGALRLFEDASAAYEKKIGDSVESGKKMQSEALQSHFRSIAPEICYGLDGLSQRQFQRMVAMIGRHTAVESAEFAQYERTREKRSNGYKKRKLSSEKEDKRRANASTIYQWLEEVLGEKFLDSDKDHREQLQAVAGGKRAPRLGVVGLECSEDGLPMEEWFARAEGDSKAYDHIGSLRCLLQSKSDPTTVDDNGDLYNSAMDNRTKRIREILEQDPERRPLSNPGHPFWVKVSVGMEDEGKQGVGKAGFQCRDMQIMGCILKLRLPQDAVNDLMDKYMRARQYRGMYLRCGEIVDFDGVVNREHMVQYNKEQQKYELVAAKQVKALVFSARRDIEQFIQTYCSRGGGFKSGTKADYRSRGVGENMAAIRAAVTHGSGNAQLATLPESEWENNSIAIADFSWELHNTLRTLHW
jgi:hypothetical protein